MVRVQKNYGGIKLRLSSIAQDDRNFNVFAFVFSHFLAICWQKKKKQGKKILHHSKIQKESNYVLVFYYKMASHVQVTSFLHYLDFLEASSTGSLMHAHMYTHSEEMRKIQLEHKLYLSDESKQQIQTAGISVYIMRSPQTFHVKVAFKTVSSETVWIELQ